MFVLLQTGKTEQLLNQGKLYFWYRVLSVLQVIVGGGEPTDQHIKCIGVIKTSIQTIGIDYFKLSRQRVDQVVQGCCNNHKVINLSKTRNSLH